MEAALDSLRWKTKAIRSVESRLFRRLPLLLRQPHPRHARLGLLRGLGASRCTRLLRAHGRHGCRHNRHRMCKLWLHRQQCLLLHLPLLVLLLVLLLALRLPLLLRQHP